MERIQRILSARGVASRRLAEEMIVAGRVSVNGVVVTELGSKADPDRDTIRVDGRIIRPQRRRYIVLNKPRGYITTTSDERDRRTVMDLVNVPERLYPVGRLDRDTEGLLLLTNDGELANRVMHPRFGLEKEYHILTETRPEPETMARVRRGITIDGRRVTPNEFRLVRETRDGVVLGISLHEGMYHVVRRMMDIAGIPVDRLTRVRVGPLVVSGIPVGIWRDLSPGEEQTLFEAVHLDLPEELAIRRRSGELEHEYPDQQHRVVAPGRTDRSFRQSVPARSGGSRERAGAPPRNRPAPLPGSPAGHPPAKNVSPESAKQELRPPANPPPVSPPPSAPRPPSDQRGRRVHDRAGSPSQPEQTGQRKQPRRYRPESPANQRPVSPGSNKPHQPPERRRPGKPGERTSQPTEGAAPPHERSGPESFPRDRNRRPGRGRKNDRRPRSGNPNRSDAL